MLQRVQASKVDCFHCGLPVVTGEQFCAELGGEQRQFCCPACRIIATTIVDNGLSSFYHYRTSSDRAPELDALEQSFEFFDDDEFQQRHVQLSQTANQTIANTQLLIGGMHCAACVWLLEQYLKKLDGLQKVSVILTEQKMVLEWQADQLTLSDICHAIARLGYKPEPYSEDHLQNLRQQENHQALRRLGVAGIGMMQVGMFAIALYAGAMQSMAIEYRDFLRWVSFLVATPVVFYAAQPFFVGAWRGLKFKKPGMDLPVALAIGLAYLASVKATLLGVGEVYFDSVSMFTFLLLAGRYLEMRARHRFGQLNSDLNSVLPVSVERLLLDGSTETVPLFKIKVGDTVIIKPGQVVPADGEVIEGSSGVDESQMTGEFSLQQKTVGDRVMAGTLNSSGAITMCVGATGSDLQLQLIGQLLSKGLSEKPRVARAVDGLASYFVVAVLLMAASTFLFWQFSNSGEYSHDAFWIALSVLVVSCPCALSLATPAALTAATNALGKQGLLVTAAQVWEAMPAITDVVCDKTGTLTKGELSLSAIHVVGDISERQCLQIAAAMERFSEHPIAKAFTDADRDRDQEYGDSVLSHSALKASKVGFSHGKGLQALLEGKQYRLGSSTYAAGLYGSTDTPLSFDHETATGLQQDGQWVLLSGAAGPLCWFQLQDSVRADAAELIAAFKSKHLRVHMLSGDDSGLAQQLSKQLGISTCIAGASPEEKLTYIEELRNSGAKVLMLGDGINDVPVLAAADVSVAMAKASNLAKTHADSILLTGQLSAIKELMALSVKTRSIIRQNLVWALSYNILAIPLAAMAMIPPYAAAIGMSLSSLIVVINALRLQRKQSEEKDNRLFGQPLMKEVTC